MVCNQQSIKTEQLIMRLYQTAFPAVAKYVYKMGGSFDDAKDIFQDALVIYYEKSVAGNLNLHKADDKPYLLGIAKNLWLKKFRGDKDNLPLLDGFDLTEEREEELSSDKLMYYLQTAGKKCMELLSAYYYEKMPMKKIAGLFGFIGERSATVQKYKCLEKVRETIKENALTYEDFVA
ncbi:RNA polymerase sigma factor [Mucilaginibacter glaciei]|uniref:Sigma-70 family RNA polymerase sigma factor n=1 Tax=Mucilaginibacter glaciei TaxID=2772109 RepID=A0A926RZ55_9SPHI|nr:sigma-70 family RNA polymerase sigma factor [Mucilaginibacter glaciei]MBD1391510.1 sigma-70 family RNA polymerase sigma factor [Mucilaginibacter glaciei]